MSGIFQNLLLPWREVPDESISSGGVFMDTRVNSPFSMYGTRTSAGGKRPADDFDESTRQTADELFDVAYKADDASMHRIDRKPVEAHLEGISDPALLKALHRGFSERLRRESISTMYGGAMAGSLCNMMRIYSTINTCLAERIKQVQGGDATG